MNSSTTPERGKEERFQITQHGNTLLGYEYEYHISDSKNKDATIIIKSGHSLKLETESIANEILSILNGKRD